MLNIVAKHKNFQLEHRPGIGYRVWHSGSFQGDIFVEADYKDRHNPNPEELHYSVFITVPSAMIFDAREAKKMAGNIVEAQEAAEVFESFLNS